MPVTKWYHLLIGGGDSVLPVVIPGGIFIQHLCPIWCPRHDVEPVPGLQRVLTPRPRLMLRLQERGGWLDAEQWARTYKNWNAGVKRGRQQVEGKMAGAEERGGRWWKGGKVVKEVVNAGVGRKWINTWKMDWIRSSWCGEVKKKEWREKGREEFKTLVLISRGKQQKRHTR